MRFGMEAARSHFAFPEEAKTKLQIEGNVFALAAPGGAGYSRKQLDELTEKSKIPRRSRKPISSNSPPKARLQLSRKLIGAEKCQKARRSLRC